MQARFLCYNVLNVKELVTVINDKKIGVLLLIFILYGSRVARGISINNRGEDLASYLDI